MGIKITRILTLVLYLGIQLSGEHIGGPLIMFLFFGFLGKSILVVMGSVLILLTIVMLLSTIFKPKTKRDKIIIPVGLIILFIPLTQHLVYLKDYYQWVDEKPFAITSGLFVILAGHWIVTTLRLRT